MKTKTITDWIDYFVGECSKNKVPVTMFQVDLLQEALKKHGEAEREKGRRYEIKNGIDRAREGKVEQLQNFQGVMGKYNCPNNCDFQKKFFELIEIEIRNQKSFIDPRDQETLNQPND